MQTDTDFSAIEKIRTLAVKINEIPDGNPIPEKFAFCAPDGKGHTHEGDNVSPAISWSDAPDDTKSYTIILVDKDAPDGFKFANQTDHAIPADFPRKDFYHWIVIDIPANVSSLPEGENMDHFLIGQNDFGARSKGYFGYDGPCPPWNDERPHHYHFQVYALDVPSLGLKSSFNGRQASEAMKGHILAMGEVVGTYTTNPKRA